MQFTYLLINFFTVLIPLGFSFEERVNFSKNFFALFKAISIVALVFIIWDIYFTDIGVWGFSEEYLLGVRIFNLPLEEILFFVCIPYACTFSYEVIKYFMKDRAAKFIDSKALQAFNYALIAVSILLVAFNYSKLYTVYTFFFLALSIIYLRKKKFLLDFYISYCVILPGFFVVNGILTGIAFAKPVVYYNNLENIGIRVFSIPVEDFFYAILMLIWTTYLFERFKVIDNA